MKERQRMAQIVNLNVIQEVINFNISAQLAVSLRTCLYVVKNGDIKMVSRWNVVWMGLILILQMWQ